MSIKTAVTRKVTAVFLQNSRLSEKKFWDIDNADFRLFFDVLMPKSAFISANQRPISTSPTASWF